MKHKMYQQVQQAKLCTKNYQKQYAYFNISCIPARSLIINTKRIQHIKQVINYTQHNCILYNIYIAGVNIFQEHTDNT